MDHISHLLAGVLRKHGLHGQATASLIVHRAQEWISGHLPEVAAMLRVRTVSDGILHIEAETGIAAEECQLHTEELKDCVVHECAVDLHEVRIGRKMNRTT
jgi:hypothetical protein